MASVIAAPEDAPRIQTTERKALPYEPGWVDRVIEGIRRLPGPSWVFYLSLWLLLFCILTLTSGPMVHLRLAHFSRSMLLLLASISILWR